MSELFDPVLAAGAVREETGDAAWLRAMLDVEVALAAAQADAGVLTRAHAEAIAEAARGAFDPAAIGAEGTGAGNPAAALVRALTERVERLDGDAARYVHLGATSQDVVDSAAMLVARRALAVVTDDLGAAAEAVAVLAASHVRTVQVGRTLLQHALPTTFGYTAAGWLSSLDSARARLRRPALPAQLGGAVGTLASLGDAGPAVHTAFARRLGLAEPVLPWHTDRTPIAELAGALGGAAGAVAGIARSITLLAQTDVGEVSERGPEGSGGSSTMPHKRNPVAAVSALGSAKRAPGLAADLLAAMDHEHQRAAGSWHAEWLPLADLLRACGSAAHWLRTSLERLQVDAGAMRANLDASGGVLLAERVTTALAPHTGRLAAHDAVTACCRRTLDGEGALVELLAADPVVGGYLDSERLVELLEPGGYLGAAEVFVERALAAHREEGEA